MKFHEPKDELESRVIGYLGALIVCVLLAAILLAFTALNPPPAAPVVTVQ